ATRNWLPTWKAWRGGWWRGAGWIGSRAAWNSIALAVPCLPPASRRSANRFTPAPWAAGATMNMPSNPYGPSWILSRLLHNGTDPRRRSVTNRYKSWLRALKAWLSSGREPSCCRPRGRRGSRQPFLEILEDRLAPATLTPLV